MFPEILVSWKWGAAFNKSCLNFAAERRVTTWSDRFYWTRSIKPPFLFNVYASTHLSRLKYLGNTKYINLWISAEQSLSRIPFVATQSHISPPLSDPRSNKALVKAELWPQTPTAPPPRCRWRSDGSSACRTTESSRSLVNRSAPSALRFYKTDGREVKRCQLQSPHLTRSSCGFRSNRRSPGYAGIEATTCCTLRPLEFSVLFAVKKCICESQSRLFDWKYMSCCEVLANTLEK